MAAHRPEDTVAASDGRGAGAGTTAGTGAGTPPGTHLKRFQALLKERGLRVTHQRLAVYECLMKSERHPSAEEIYDALHPNIPSLSLATVYKTLDMLVEMGLALKLGFGDDVNRYEGNPEPHINLICVRCKQFVDHDEERLVQIAAEVGRKTGFVLLSQRFELYGLCPQCGSDAGDDISE